MYTERQHNVYYKLNWPDVNSSIGVEKEERK